MNLRKPSVASFPAASFALPASKSGRVRASLTMTERLSVEGHPSRLGMFEFSVCKAARATTYNGENGFVRTDVPYPRSRTAVNVINSQSV